MSLSDDHGAIVIIVNRDVLFAAAVIAGVRYHCKSATPSPLLTPWNDDYDGNAAHQKSHSETMRVENY